LIISSAVTFSHIVRLEDNVGLRRFASVRVVDTDHGDLLDGRVAIKKVFNIAGRRYSRNILSVPCCGRGVLCILLIHDTKVAGVEPPVAEHLCGLFRFIPITQER